jgi:hypothetical protein
LTQIKNDAGGVREQLEQLSESLVSVRCANKDSQNGGITVGLFATSADALLDKL